MNARSAVAVVLAAVGSLLALAPNVRADGMSDELAKLKGSWTPVMIDKGEGPMSKEDLENKYGVRIKFDGDAVTMQSLKPDPAEKPESETIVAIDPKAKPATLILMRDLGPGQGKYVTRMIYALDGDTLKICFDKTNGAPLAKEFKAGDGYMLIVLKREK